MDGVTPVGGGPVLPSNFSSSAAPVGNVTYQDSIASGGQVQQSLLSFATLMSNTKTELQETIKLLEEAQAKSRIPLYRAMADEITSLLSRYALIRAVADAANPVYVANQNDVTTLTSSLGTYNANVNADNQAVATMNQATTDYLNGDINQAAYNDAVDTYNAYVADQNARANDANTAINNFNSNAFSTNAQFTSFNATLPSGVSDFTLQDTYATRQLLPTLPHAPPDPTTTISAQSEALTPENTITPSVDPTSNFTSVYVAPLLSFFSFFGITVTSVSLKKLKNLSHFVFDKLLAFKGTAISLPNSYTQRDPTINIGGAKEAGGAGSSVPLAVAIAGLSNSLITAIIGDSLIKSVLEESRKINPAVVKEGLAQELGLLGAALILQMGLLSSNTAIRLLGGNGAMGSIDPRSSIAAVAIGTAFLGELVTAISSGFIRESVEGDLRTKFPKLSEKEIKKLAKNIANGIENFLLQLGILNLSIGLGSPLLLGRLLSTITSEGSAYLQNPATSFGNFLNNPIHLANVAADIAAQANISQEQATAIANSDAVKSATNADELRAAIQQGSIAQGANAADAITAAAVAAANVQSEVSGQNLFNQTINLAVIKGTTYENAAVLAILEKHGGSLTGRELRDEIAHDLQQKQGGPAYAAELTATLYLSSLFPAIPPQNADDVKNEIRVRLNQADEEGNYLTAQQNLNDELKSILLDGNENEGRQSAIQILKENINSLASLNDAKIDAEFTKLHKNILAPYVDVYQLAQALTDPATHMVFLASGDMYHPDQPPGKPGSLGSQIKQDIDIHI